MGNQHPSIAPYETLRCRDGVLAVAVGNDGQFRRFVGGLGRADLADDHRFATNADRVRHRGDLVAELEAALTQRSAREWQRLLTAADVPASVVGDLRSALDLATELGLEPTTEVGAGHPPQVRHPITYSRSRVTEATPPPGLGEHDDEIRDWLAEERRQP